MFARLSCVVKTLTLVITQNCSTKFVIPAMRIGTIDIYHFISLSLTLTLPAGSQGQRKAKPVGFIFSHTFPDLAIKQIKLNILRLHLSKMYWNKGNNCCFTDCVKKTKPKQNQNKTKQKQKQKQKTLEKQAREHAFGCLRMDLIQSWYDDKYYCTLHFDTSLTLVILWSQECEIAECSAPIISQSFQSIWMECGILLRFVSVINLIFISSCPFVVHGREPYLYYFVWKQNLNVGLFSDIWRPIYFKLGMMIRTTKLYMLIPVWITLTFIQGHSCIRNSKTSVSLFSQI